MANGPYGFGNPPSIGTVITVTQIQDILNKKGQIIADISGTMDAAEAVPTDNPRDSADIPRTIMKLYQYINNVSLNVNCTTDDVTNWSTNNEAKCIPDNSSQWTQDKTSNDSGHYDDVHTSDNNSCYSNNQSTDKGYWNNKYGYKHNGDDNGMHRTHHGNKGQ